MDTLTFTDPETGTTTTVEVEDLCLSYIGGPPDCAEQKAGEPNMYRLGRVQVLVQECSPPRVSDGQS
ncbi:MAG TPA: hypothetical protein VHR18_13435 [Solirubrobacterales bacterium]|jgi:hypothetical protein|nr:hypothetical protein [Solirubrobacterales bacterium]